MHGIVEWGREHKLLSLGLIGALIILFVVLKRGGGGSSGAVVVSSGPSDAVQVAGLQAGAANQANLINAALSAQQLQSEYKLGAAKLDYDFASLKLGADAHNQDTATAAAVQYATLSSQLEALRSQNDTQLGINKLGAETQIGLASIAAGTTQFTTASNNAVLTHQLDKNAEQFAYQLDTEAKIVDNNNRTSIANNKINADLQQGIVAENARVALHINDNATFIQGATIAGAVNADNNRTAVLVKQIDTQGQVYFKQIDASRDIAGQTITAQKDVLLHNADLTAGYYNHLTDAQLSSQQFKYAFDQNYINLIGSGKLQGGDAVAVIAAFNNQPAIGVAAQGAAAVDAQANSLPAIVASFGTAISKIGTAFFGGV